LAPIAGNAAKLLLAIGLIGAGLLAVAESFGWKHGLNRKLSNAREFYALIAGSTIIAMILNFVGIDPMKALFWAAVLNGVLAPPLLIIIMLVSQNRKIMGVRTNGRVLNTLAARGASSDS
jgi:Mn2+/Fe2+ NRAMP family transporter